MSAGDIDDRLGSSEELGKYLNENANFKAYYNQIPNLAISKASIPFGAGISEDGQTPYIDERLDTMFEGVDIAECLKYHECTEWALREFCHVGLDYAADPRGHRLANRAEYTCLRQLFGTQEYIDLWEAYNAFLDPQLRKIEHEPLDDVPGDLAMYPYEGTEWEEKIREAQAEAGNKVSKASVNYRPAQGNHKCGNCGMFHNDACDLVQGTIDPQATCDEWVPE